MLNKELKDKLSLVYEISMILLAIIVVIILALETFVDFGEGISGLLSSVDLYILIIFAIDYFTRLIFIANDRLYFIKNNKADLIAIMPFSSVFRVARIARLARLGRLARVTRMTRLSRFLRFFRVFRIAAVSKKAFVGFKGVLKTNGLHLVIVFTMFVVLLGAIGMYQLEQGHSVHSFGDSLWWSFVTTTTVGYGDITPITTSGRALASILMVIGIGFVGMVTGTIATYFVKKAEEVVKSDDEINKIKEQLDDFEDLSLKEVKEINNTLLELKQ